MSDELKYRDGVVEALEFVILELDELAEGLGSSWRGKLVAPSVRECANHIRDIRYLFLVNCVLPNEVNSDT